MPKFSLIRVYPHPNLELLGKVTCSHPPVVRIYAMVFKAWRIVRRLPVAR